MCPNVLVQAAPDHSAWLLPMPSLALPKERGGYGKRQQPPCSQQQTGAGLQMDNQLDIQQDRHQRYLLLEGEDHGTHTHEKNVSGISSPIHFTLSCWSLCYR